MWLGFTSDEIDSLSQRDVQLFTQTYHLMREERINEIAKAVSKVLNG